MLGTQHAHDPRRQVGAGAILDTQRSGSGSRQQARIGHGAEVDQVHAVGKVGPQAARYLDSRARLAHAAAPTRVTSR